MKIVTVQQMRAIEQSAVLQGVSLDQLQRQAAEAVAVETARIAGTRDGPVLFLAGGGNNGRDSLIAALLTVERGGHARVIVAPGVESEDVSRSLVNAGVPLHQWSGPESGGLLGKWVQHASAVVDGLLGIGVRGSPRGAIAEIISSLNRATGESTVPVVSVDLPSGIDADTGDTPGGIVRASHTVSLGAVKSGLLRFPGAAFVGDLIPVDIGLPAGTDDISEVSLLSRDLVARLIPSRPIASHKGSVGRVLVIGGSDNYVGAPYFSAAAAARSGCGLVTLAVPGWQVAALATLMPEATFAPRDDMAESSIDAVRGLATAPDKFQAVVLGPGLGRGESTRKLAVSILRGRTENSPVAVVDADALNALSTATDWWKEAAPGCVLTPHPGEMARLSGVAVRDVEAERWRIAADAARRWRQIVVLKGPFTVISSPGGETWVNPFASAALATAGSGDVLAGLIAGLAAQGASALDSALCGVALHSQAAREAMSVMRSDRLIASDLLPAIPRSFAKYNGRG